MQKTLIYTAVTKNYDKVKPVKTHPNFDFWLYTDDKHLKVEGWEIKLIPTPRNPQKNKGR